jgi:hypothetical protein
MGDSETSEAKGSGILDPSSMPKIYINGFSVGMSLSDIYILTEIAGSPSAMLLMSFTTAKTLAQHLMRAVSDFESMTGQSLLTMEDVHQAAEAAKSAKE